MRIWIIVLSVWILSACQSSPTAVREQVQPNSDAAFAAEVLKQNPVILDVRPTLDFGVSHVPGAINVSWRDFTWPGGREGELDRDFFALARRLSLWGVDPQTPVLLLSGGGVDRAEAAWIAWMMKILGVEQIHLGTTQRFRGQIPREGGAPSNRPLWKPETHETLLATPAEGRAFLKGSATSVIPVTAARSKALQGAMRPPEQSRRRIVLDVRSLMQRTALPVVRFGWSGAVVEIEWTKFFTERGSVAESVRDLLRTAGLDGAEEILVVSDVGLESGAVAFALDELKFGRPKNLSAGLRGLDGAR